MIIVYPMLTSDTVPSTVLPGITKALERFVIVYRLEQDLPKIKAAKDVNLQLLNLNLFNQRVKSLGESISSINEDDGSLIKSGPRNPQQRGPHIIAAGSGVFKGDAAPQQTVSPKFPTSIDVNLKQKSKPEGNLKVDAPNKQDIMLEPTYITAQTKAGPTLIGVKVIPFPLKSTKSGESAADLIQNEKDLKMAYAITLSLGRQIIRLAWGTWTDTILRMFPIIARTISGDPRRDVIYASTEFSDKTFICFDSMDLKDSFTQSASNIKKLHYLGWRSFLLVDSVNKKVNFCMKEFGGLCNVIPFQFLYSSLGQSQKQTFEDLEDIKKSSSAFFRQKVSKSKVLGENLALSKVDYMLSEKKVEFENNSDIESLNEGIIDYAKSFGHKLISDVKIAIKSKDTDKVGKVLEKLPNIDPEKIKQLSKKQNPEFQKLYAFSKRVVDNSLPNDVDEEIKDAISMGYAIKAINEEGDPYENVKNDLRNDLPALMRILGAGAKTSATLIFWFFISRIVFTVSLPYVIVISLLILARGIYKYAKKEGDLNMKDIKHKQKIEKMEKDVEKSQAQASRGPYINVQKG